MIVHAEVYEQTPHPMFGSAPFVVVRFDDPTFASMDRRRIKREYNRAIKKWRKQKSNDRRGRYQLERR
jgi:hypothetical protein